MTSIAAGGARPPMSAIQDDIRNPPSSSGAGTFFDDMNAKPIGTVTHTEYRDNNVPWWKRSKDTPTSKPETVTENIYAAGGFSVDDPHAPDPRVWKGTNPKTGDEVWGVPIGLNGTPTLSDGAYLAVREEDATDIGLAVSDEATGGLGHSATVGVFTNGGAAFPTPVELMRGNADDAKYGALLLAPMQNSIGDKFNTSEGVMSLNNRNLLAERDGHPVAAVFTSPHLRTIVEAPSILADSTSLSERITDLAGKARPFIVELGARV